MIFPILPSIDKTKNGTDRTKRIQPVIESDPFVTQQSNISNSEYDSISAALVKAKKTVTLLWSCSCKNTITDTNTFSEIF